MTCTNKQAESGGASACCFRASDLTSSAAAGGGAITGPKGAPTGEGTTGGVGGAGGAGGDDGSGGGVGSAVFSGSGAAGSSTEEGATGGVGGAGAAGGADGAGGGVGGGGKGGRMGRVYRRTWSGGPTRPYLLAGQLAVHGLLPQRCTRSLLVATPSDSISAYPVVPAWFCFGFVYPDSS